MTFADGKRIYFHQDVLGSILAVSDGTGEVGGKYSYDAFGNILDQHEKGLHQPLRLRAGLWMKLRDFTTSALDSMIPGWGVLFARSDFRGYRGPSFFCLLPLRPR